MTKLPKMEDEAKLLGEDRGSSKVPWSKMTPADYFKLLNIQSAKTIAIFLVIFFALYHGILNLSYGKDIIILILTSVQAFIIYITSILYIRPGDLVRQ